MNKIGLIGTGHMGSAILKAADKADLPLSFLLSDVRNEAAEALAGALSHDAAVRPAEALVREADLLFLAVRPCDLASLITGLRPAFEARKAEDATRPLTIITMAAGVPVARILELIGTAFPVIRIMPNTPVEVSRGVIGWTRDNASDEAVSLFRSLLEASALLVEVPESELDAVCAVSGCGPAFVYLMIRGMADAAEKLGLSPEDATLLSAKTLEGASGMVLSGKGTPTALAKAVATPGGATEAGVNSLISDGFETVIGNAVEASYRRTLELK